MASLLCAVFNGTGAGRPDLSSCCHCGKHAQVFHNAASYTWNGKKIRPYNEFPISYGKLMEYVEVNQVETKWESFEFYHTDPESEPNVTKWQTLIAFPMK